MAEIVSARVGSAIAQREVTHPPEPWSSRPAQVGPGCQRLGRGPREGAWRSPAVHVAVGVAGHARQRLSAGPPDQRRGAGGLGSWADFALFPKVSDRFELFAKAAPPAAAIDSRRLIVLS